MSAANSGFVIPYVAVAPTTSDLTNIKIGQKVYQIAARYNIAQPIYSDWYITKSNSDPIYMLPLKSKYIRNSRAFAAIEINSTFTVKNGNI